MTRKVMAALSGLILLLTLLLGEAPSEAFHEGGVGYCEGCHSLHPVRGTHETAPGPLLRGSDPSSTCLRCHAEAGSVYNVLSSDGSSFNPGGDFHWLKRTFDWPAAGGTRVSPGNRHGHNVVAADYGLGTDVDLTAAPGGDFPAMQLGCQSCHDPHALSGGNLPWTAEEGATGGNFRLLGDIGYNSAPGIVFSRPVPVAVASSRDWRESNTNHTAYGSGMSEWCANCHAAMLSGDARRGGDHKHPAGDSARLPAAILARYNAYLHTGNLSGSRASAYLFLVPFEAGTIDRSRLDPASTAGPEAGANVMCLTCHRAHASAFAGSGRWDFGETFLARSHPRPDDIGARPADPRHSYYGRDAASLFGPLQRQLCSKCHAVD